MPRFQDIPQFTRGANWVVDVGWDYLPRFYYSHVMDHGLDVNPNFQRAHVWTATQKVRYVEYVLQGGKSGLDIQTNCPTWNSCVSDSWYVLVDGKQRIDAVIGFLSNELKAFGHYRREYTDLMRITHLRFKWHVNELKTIEEVYQWYIDLNSGGTVHTPEEIEKVQDFLARKVQYTKLTGPEAEAAAHLDRAAIVEAAKAAEAEAKEREFPTHTGVIGGRLKRRRGRS